MASNGFSLTRIKRRLTFSTPVAALEEQDGESTPKVHDSARPNKNARICNSPFSFAVPPRQTASFLRTPTMKSMAPAQHARTHSRRGRFSRAIATPTSTSVLNMAASQHASHAVPAQVRSRPHVTPDPATRAVYENLFGCPAQFASVAEVHPDSQGPAGDANVTPLGGDHGSTPATMLAVSAFTEHSDRTKSNEKTGLVSFLDFLVVASTAGPLLRWSDALPVQDELHQLQSGVFDMAGFGSPAVAVQDEGLIGAMPSSAPFRTFLQAVTQAQAAQNDAHAVIRSPWAPAGPQDDSAENIFLQQRQVSCTAIPQPDSGVVATLQQTRCGGNDHSLSEQPGPRFSMMSDHDSFRQGSSRTTVHDTECSLRRSDGPFGVGVACGPLQSAVLGPSAEAGMTNVGTYNPSVTAVSFGGLSGDASDSDMEDSMGGTNCGVSESEDDEEGCMQQQVGCTLQLERLAADLDDRFEALSMLSPDNQIPLLSRSLGRRVSVHGAHTDILEPWGRAAVFGCNTTSSGKLSITASLAGSAHSHGPGTAVLKLARSEARHGASAAAVLDMLEDVKTPLTSGKRKDEVLSTIGAPLEVPSRYKCNRTPSASPVPFSVRLGACMLEPARRSTPGTTECPSGHNTEASSPETAGRGSSRVSAVRQSLTSLFEEIHANPHGVCDI